MSEFLEDLRQWDWLFFIKGMGALAALACALFLITNPGTPVGDWLAGVQAGAAGSSPHEASLPPIQPFAIGSVLASDQERAQLCLTQAIYYEARGEGREGERAVAQVVLNRLADPMYPKSVCGVVYQGSQLKTGCQFSFTCDGSLSKAPVASEWRQASEIARHALAGRVFFGVQSATHYHADYVKPAWRTRLSELTRIGRHVFYAREPQKTAIALVSLRN